MKHLKALIAALAIALFAASADSAVIAPTNTVVGAMPDYASLQSNMNSIVGQVNTLNNTTSATVTATGSTTVTAGNLLNRVVLRTGATGAATDTTDTAANIIATIGASASALTASTTTLGNVAINIRYVNTTGFAVTLAGGTGVTLSGVSIIPPGQYVELILTAQSATAVTFTGVSQGPVVSLPDSQFVTNSTAGATTAAAGDLTGAKVCTLLLTAVGAANYTTRTATQMIADIPGAYLNQSYMLIVKNTNAGTTTIVGGTGVTITGTATVAQNTARFFNVTITNVGTPAIVLQSFGVTATI